jgi:hypothetical protein
MQSYGISSFYLFALPLNRVRLQVCRGDVRVQNLRFFSFSCCVGLAPADTFGDGSSPLKKGLRLQAGAKILRFNQVGRAFLFVWACCLIVATSGCGAGVSKSLGGGLLVSPGNINFGSVPVGHEADSNVNVSNSSSSSIVISQVSISGRRFRFLAVVICPSAFPLVAPAL